MGDNNNSQPCLSVGDDEKKLKGKKAKEVRKKEKDSKLASREQRKKEQRERFTNREPTKIGDNQVTWSDKLKFYFHIVNS